MLVISSILSKKANLKAPPMGWNSWNSFHGDVSEQLIKDTADAFIKTGLKDAGYQYVVIDDGYILKERDNNGDMIPDKQRFPNGFKGLSDYVHSKGLKYGMYNCAGTLTCMGLAGSFGHEAQDAKMFSSWDIDFLKYDFCYNPIVNMRFAPDIGSLFVDNKKYPADDAIIMGNARLTDGFVGYIGDSKGDLIFNVEVSKQGIYDISFEFLDTESRPFELKVNKDPTHVWMCNFTTASFNHADKKNCTLKLALKSGKNTLHFFNNLSSNDNAHYSYQRMAEQLQALPNVPVFSVCEWGSQNPWFWGADVGNIWRTTYDINDDWGRVMELYEQNVVLDKYAEVNGWNDPDMLTVGMPNMNHNMNIAEFSLWCIMTSPLLLGNDLRNISNETLKIIMNKNAIAVNQDPNAIQGIRIFNNDNLQVLAKPLANGSVAVVIFNKDNQESKKFKVDLKYFDDQIDLIDEEAWLWAKEYILFDIWSDKITSTVKQFVEGQIEPLGTFFYIVTPKE